MISSKLNTYVDYDCNGAIGDSILTTLDGQSCLNFCGIEAYGVPLLEFTTATAIPSYANEPAYALRPLKKIGNNTAWWREWAYIPSNSNCCHGPWNEPSWWRGELDGSHKIYLVRLYRRTEVGELAEVAMTVGSQ